MSQRADSGQQLTYSVFVLAFLPLMNAFAMDSEVLLGPKSTSAGHRIALSWIQKPAYEWLGVLGLMSAHVRCQMGVAAVGS